jgi:hypothetical protein
VHVRKHLQVCAEAAAVRHATDDAT